MKPDRVLMWLYLLGVKQLGHGAGKAFPAQGKVGNSGFLLRTWGKPSGKRGLLVPGKENSSTRRVSSSLELEKPLEEVGNEREPKAPLEPDPGGSRDRCGSALPMAAWRGASP